MHLTQASFLRSVSTVIATTNVPPHTSRSPIAHPPLGSVSELFQSPIMATSVASKRLFTEYRHLTNDPPQGITAGPVTEDDIFIWEALIEGPEGTPFEGGVFPAELKFPKDYPLAPPTMKFTCDMWHPNGTPPLSSPPRPLLALG